MSIFPFEEKWFKKRNIVVDFVGHPIVNEYKDLFNSNKYKKDIGLDSNSQLFVLFPGSRLQEIKNHLPLCIQVANIIKNKLPNVMVVLGLAKSISKNNTFNIPNFIYVEKNHPKQALHAADAAIISSGTATLEAAFLNIPSVIIYKTSNISWIISKFFMKSNYIGMPNIILDKEIVPEFFQNKIDIKKISLIILSYLIDNKKNIKTRDSLRLISQKLGKKDASFNAAKLILSNNEK